MSVARRIPPRTAESLRQSEFTTNPDGASAQTTTIRQQYLSEQAAHGDDGEESFSVISNTVTPSDTLLFDANFNVTGSTGQQSAQKFFSNNSSSGCFSRSIAAAHGLLATITDGAGCEDGDDGHDHDRGHDSSD